MLVKVVLKGKCIGEKLTAVIHFQSYQTNAGDYAAAEMLLLML
jgi:hypothetical protein